MKGEQVEKLLSVDYLRHAEYYDMQKTLDDLYARAKSGEVFTDLMSTVLSRENILLAYRNIKTNSGSNTPGTDKVTINSIGKMEPEEMVQKVRHIVCGRQGYRSRLVRRKDIPKPSGGTRPLGIPCIWDRLIQQCIKQIMDPICEAHFSEHSYGFRPNRSVENAIAEVYRRMQVSNLHYVVEFDIKGFFDNVDHSKLIRQIWALGIHDKHLIYVLKQILKAPIKLPDGKILHPDRGTPQGGIISPLLANVVLNELDHWVENEWEFHPVALKYAAHIQKSGAISYDYGHDMMKKTKLKEMWIVRYADDFRVFCRTKNAAEHTKIAITQWLKERLKLDTSPEKTKVVNVKRKYSDFLGFKIKVRPKRGKLCVCSHISDKALSRLDLNISNQARRLFNPRSGKNELDECKLYNAMVVGIQNYYCLATEVNHDLHTLNRNIYALLKEQFASTGCEDHRRLTKFEQERYGKSRMLKYLVGAKEPVYPIGYVQHKIAKHKARSICSYTIEGRKKLHNNLRVNMSLMRMLMLQSPFHRSTEFCDNRISLFSGQYGRCAISDMEFKTSSDIHCHHILPISCGGDDSYGNLILVLEPIHRLIHATNQETIDLYLSQLKLNSKQIERLNKYRVLAGNKVILNK